MTYRNDHDAALARIDALESELARARADDGANAARAELDRLESEIKRRRAERDRLEREVEDAKPSNRYRGAKLALTMVGVAVLLGIRALMATQHQPPPPPPPPPSQPIPSPTPSPAALPAPSPAATRLVECARELDHAIEAKAASSATCIAQLKLASTDSILGDDVHALLVRWLAAEEAVGHSDGALEQRDALAPEIHRVIIPSFTR
jgi:hypothetical protein